MRVEPLSSSQPESVFIPEGSKEDGEKVDQPTEAEEAAGGAKAGFRLEHGSAFGADHKWFLLSLLFVGRWPGYFLSVSSLDTGVFLDAGWPRCGQRRR